MQGRFERPRNDLLLPPIVVGQAPQRIGLRGDDAWQLVKELPHVRRERRAELVEGAFEFVAERGAGKRLE